MYLSATTESGYDATRALYELTGPPALLPRYALGFMASWWGYRTWDDVNSNMTAFRDGHFPVDSFIMVRSLSSPGSQDCDAC